VDDLQNQTMVQRYCLRDLNWSPFRVKDNDWIATINKSMEGIEERFIEIPRATDTSETAALHGYFLRFLARKEMRRTKPQMVQAHQVYHEDGFFYFDTEGLKRFLDMQRFKSSKINLRAELERYGCELGELTYKNPSGVEKTIECWKKADDDELKAMDGFYEDIYEGDADTLQNNKLNKEDKEVTDDDGDTKF
jgi:hypothetical protein